MDYGIIGNCKSAALIDIKGTIIWCCLPDFDSSSVFAKLIDAEKGGEFRFIVDESYEIKQRYLPNTNILETTFTHERGAFQVLDFMPRYKTEDSGYIYPPEVVRYVKHLSGTPSFRIHYRPKLGYAKHETCSEDQGNFIKSFVRKGVYESVYLYTNVEHSKVLNCDEIHITKDVYFILSYHQKLLALTTEKIELEFERTKVYWLEWVQRSINFTCYTDEVRRSALVLKLLTYQESGAILAAVTTSLPETIGEERNWDYRFCWIRDASMTLNILTKLGHFNVAKNFFKYIMRVVPYKSDKIQIMYGISGRKELTERTLDWLSGYKYSKPVRIGNAAYVQKQNDIYGVLIDAIYGYIETFRNDTATVERLWTMTRSLLRTVSESWNEPDMGIWEFRSNPAHFVFSKVLCWLAFDRGIKIAEELNCDKQYEEWKVGRQKIKDEILEKGWNAELGAFTQTFGGNNVDASNLLMAHYGFIDYKDPLFISTVKVTRKKLCRDGLMYRYRNEDDFGMPSSSFIACSFWLVKALWKIGEKQEAKAMFETLLTYRNHLGLMSEDLDFETKKLLGNFPQGYSHIALIDCAVNLCGGDMTKESGFINFIQNK